MATVNLYLDKRKGNAMGRFPVKILLFHAGKQYLVSTKIFTAPALWEMSYSVNKNKTKYAQTLRRDADNARTKAEAICEKLGSAFTLEKFKATFFAQIDYTTKGQRLNVFDLYAEYIREIKKNGCSPKTVSYHEASSKCFKKFAGEDLALQDITVEWLNGFEAYMLGRGKTLTSTSTYARSLRTIYKKAIDDELIGREGWPFGKRKYSIVSAESAKSALNREEIERFKAYQPQTNAQQAAKDFWLFMYFCCGIAPVDMVNLSWRNIQGNMLIFSRQKTKKSRKEAKMIKVHIRQEMWDIIQRQGNSKTEHYIFPILKPGMKAEEKVKEMETWKRLLNRVLNRMSVKLKYNFKLNCYAARHSYASVMQHHNIPIADIADALGHASVSMTHNYLSGITHEKAKVMADLL